MSGSWRRVFLASDRVTSPAPGGWISVGLWGMAAMAALLWPGHLDGPLDGAPLDRVTEAILIGLVAPVLWWLHPSFLRHRMAQALIAALMVAKAAAVPLAQDGWCVQFDTPRPLVANATGRIHAWDVRADWLAAAPRCSAIMTRPYREYREFPVWFFNLPPADNNLPQLEDRPPFASFDMTVSGYLHADDRGELIIETGDTMTTSLVVDGASITPVSPSRSQAVIEPGRHFVQVKSRITSSRWSFVPLWNGAPIGSTGFASVTLSAPSSTDEAVRGVLSLLTQLLAGAFIAAWIASFARCWPDRGTLAFGIGAAALMAWLGYPDVDYQMTPWAIASVTALGAAVLLQVPQHVRNLRGAFVMIGLPWLAFVTAVQIHHVGRFSLYAAGDDMWTFQRFAYRIYLQGYWLQGGEQTFWFQPFYRWIAGAWHMLFGDSSMGEFWWDGIAVLASALFAHVTVAGMFGFKWGIGAAVLALTIAMHSPTWMFIGIGLSDLASAGCIYLSALIVATARERGDVRLGAAIAAGLLGAIGFYTRLNNLPMALAVSAFAIPLTASTHGWWRLTPWWRHVSWKAVCGVLAMIALAVFLFTLRTYYYTGVFSFFHGTTWGNHALWQPSHSAAENLAAMLSSLMMVLTFNDPPRFAWYALPLLTGLAVALAAMIGVPGLRVPLPLALFFLVACSGALAARGVAYAGRFSVHLLGAGCALTMCAVASLLKTRVEKLILGSDPEINRGSFRSSGPVRE